jgi:hypothetical protein
MVSGKRDRMVGKIQECYGVARDEAERQVTDWEAQYGDTLDESHYAPHPQECRRGAALIAVLDGIRHFRPSTVS